MNVIELTAPSLDVLRPATHDMRGDGLITTPAPVCESWPKGLMPDDYMLGWRRCVMDTSFGVQNPIQMPQRNTLPR
jgi:hypothetical protein